MQIGVPALWQAVGFAAGYLALLLFVAAPLRRFGSYTLPDFAEGRLASRVAAGAWRSPPCSRSTASIWSPS